VELVNVVLFLHITAALVAFGVSAVVHTGEWASRSATTVQGLRQARSSSRRAEPLFPLMVVILFVLGAWLIQLDRPAFQFTDGWVVASTVALVVLLAVGGAALAPRSKRLTALLDASADGPLSPEARAATQDPVVWRLSYLCTGIAVGIVFLMTVKPALLPSVVALVVAAALGAAVGSLGLERTRRLSLPVPGDAQAQQ
jgi:hypothetical protein